LEGKYSSIFNLVGVMAAPRSWRKAALASNLAATEQKEGLRMNACGGRVSHQI